MKKTFLMILLAMLLVAAVSFAESVLLDAAWSLLPEEAQLVSQDKDDGLYEFEFRSDDVDYEAVLNPDGAPLMLKKEYRGVKGGERVQMSLSAMEAEALAVAGEGAVIDYALQKADDKRHVWVFFVRRGEDAAEIEFNAETGALKEVEWYYDAAGGLLPLDILARLTEEKGGVILTEADLELEDGVLVCSGEATLDGKTYEFEVRTRDGMILEWERD